MTTEGTGFLGNLQAKLHESFNKPTNWYIEVAGYLIAGFIIGFLIKHGGRFFFWLLLGAALALWALELLQVISIDYSMLKALFGLSSDMTVHDVFARAVVWVQSHMIECLAGLLGFILAWKFA